jgi:hypothetical protein
VPELSASGDRAGRTLALFPVEVEYHARPYGRVREIPEKGDMADGKTVIVTKVSF